MLCIKTLAIQQAKPCSVLQAALACFESKIKLLQQAKILKDDYVVTAQEPLPDDLVTVVQVAPCNLVWHPVTHKPVIAQPNDLSTKKLL